MSTRVAAVAPEFSGGAADGSAKASQGCWPLNTAEAECADGRTKLMLWHCARAVAGVGLSPGPFWLIVPDSRAPHLPVPE